MSFRTLFIGTSFLGAIKQGYEALYATNSSTATFVGFNAPELVAHLESGWHVKDGRLILRSDLGCFVSGLEHCNASWLGSKTFPGSSKVSGLEIDLRSYGRIIFVDMFHRLRPPFRVTDKLIPTLDGIPISDAMLDELQIIGFNGWNSLAQHPQYGTVPFVNAKRLVTAIREGANSASVLLLSAPRPPVGNIDIKARYGDVASARRCFDYLERFYANELSRHDIEYLPQPSEVLDDDGCLTRAQYSRGMHPSKAGFVDEHMNQQYGEAILAEYSESILEI